MKQITENSVLGATSAMVRICSWVLIAVTALLLSLGTIMLLVTTFAGPDFFSGGGWDSFPDKKMAGIYMGIGMLFAGCGVYFIGRFLKRLREIVLTVKQGNPLTIVNAKRLREMGWTQIASAVFFFGATFTAAMIYGNLPYENHDAAQIVARLPGLLSQALMIAVPFILARIFEQGAEMREELEGTV
jgi:hypothetical protein